MLFNCDWFSFSIVSHAVLPVCVPEGVQEQVCTGTNIYRHRRIYSLNGWKLFTVLGDPYSGILRPDLLLVEVGNFWLYQPIDFWALLLQLYPFAKVNNLSRVDLCCDFTCSDEQMQVIRCLCDGSLYVSSKRSGVIFYDVEQNERVPKCLNFGSISSDVKWKLYDKTKEINATSPDCTKPYIRDAWRAAGLGIERVWRLELSYHADKFEDPGRLGFRFGSVYDVEMIRLVFSELYDKRFSVRRRSHTRAVNDEVVNFLSLSAECHQHRIPPASRMNEEQVRVTLTHLCNDYIKGSGVVLEPVQCQIASSIVSICEHYGMYAYVLQKFGVDIRHGVSALLASDPRKVLRG